MGLESLLALAIPAANMLVQRSQGRKIARATRTANAIESAQGSIDNMMSRRRAAREERVRRARLIQGAKNGGVSGSSGEQGALSSLSSNVGATVANQRGAELAARGISAALQRSADAQTLSTQFDQLTKLADKGLTVSRNAGLFD